MTKVNFEDTTQKDILRERLRKPYRSKRKQMHQSLKPELPPDRPINGTMDEKIEVWRALQTNLPRWMK